MWHWRDSSYSWAISYLVQVCGIVLVGGNIMWRNMNLLLCLQFVNFSRSQAWICFWMLLLAHLIKYLFSLACDCFAGHLKKQIPQQGFTRTRTLLTLYFFAIWREYFRFLFFVVVDFFFHGSLISSTYSIISTLFHGLQSIFLWCNS